MEQAFLGNDIEAIYLLEARIIIMDYPAQDLDIVVISDRLIDTKVIQNRLALYFSNMNYRHLKYSNWGCFRTTYTILFHRYVINRTLFYGKDTF